jgi:hypothetical protein
MFSWLRRLNLRSRPSTTTITTIQLTSDGFSVIEHDGSLRQVAWASVKEIFVFKLDMGTIDTIRLGVRLSDDGSNLQVDEDAPGFRDLLAEIERRFDIVDRNWWSKVAFPAFATNRTTLWGEPWTEP